MSTRDILELVAEEVAFAISKYPTFNSAHEGYAIILEELDELWEVIKLKQETPNRDLKIRKEAIQVAAMAVRFLLDHPHFKN